MFPHLPSRSATGTWEYEPFGLVDLSMQSGRTTGVVALRGWRTDIGYPADRDGAERRLEATRQWALGPTGD